MFEINILFISLPLSFLNCSNASALGGGVDGRGSSTDSKGCPSSLVSDGTWTGDSDDFTIALWGEEMWISHGVKGEEGLLQHNQQRRELTELLDSFPLAFISPAVEKSRGKPGNKATELPLQHI